MIKRRKVLFGSEAGFTIVEALIAATLIAMVFLGILALFGAAIKTSAQSNKTLIASMLAQEGSALIMNIRDTNWIKGNGWQDGLGNPSDFKQQAGVINYDESSVTYAKAIGCGTDETTFFECSATKLYLDATNNFYTHTQVGNEETGFRRIVVIKRDNPNNRLIVTSVVRWGNPNDKREVRLTTHLYDWMP